MCIVVKKGTEVEILRKEHTFYKVFRDESTPPCVGGPPLPIAKLIKIEGEMFGQRKIYLTWPSRYIRDEILKEYNTSNILVDTNEYWRLSNRVRLHISDGIDENYDFHTYGFHCFSNLEEAQRFRRTMVEMDGGTHYKKYTIKHITCPKGTKVIRGVCKMVVVDQMKIHGSNLRTR